MGEHLLPLAKTPQKQRGRSTYIVHVVATDSATQQPVNRTYISVM